MKKVRLGIVGVGRMGSNHARVSTRLFDTDVVGFCDIDKNRVNKVCNKYSVNGFYDYKELLNYVDAVIISVETKFHYDIAKFFINNKKHVLIEKPITIEVNEAEELLSLAKKNKVLISVGHVERFNSAIEALEDLINPNDIIGVSIKRMSPMDYRVKDIDVILDLMIHDIDIVLNMMKSYEIKQVYAVGNIVKEQSRKDNYVDYAIAYLKFSNGVTIDLTASRVTEKKIREVYISNLNDFIKVDYMNKELVIHKSFKADLQEVNYRKGIKYNEESLIKKVHVNDIESLYQEQQNFINAIMYNERLKVTGEDGIRALKVAKQIQQHVYNNNAYEVKL